MRVARFRDWGVRAKLYGAFGVLVLLLASLMFSALVYLTKLYDTTDTLGNQTCAKADAANDLIKFTLTAANSYRDLALSSNPRREPRGRQDHP